MKKTGFTLIELMIVVAIIAIIAAIAIPNLLRSRIQSNESAAIGNLRTVLGAENAYNSAKGEYGSFANLTTGSTPPFLDGTWPGTKSGYTFAEIGLGGTGNSKFSSTAVPVGQGTTGSRGFYVDESGVIRAGAGGSATSGGTPIGQQ